MSGPTDFPQLQVVTNTATQAITTTTETIIATSNPINSRGANYPININASAVFTVQAAATACSLRLRLTNLTGTLLGQTQIVEGATAGSNTAGDGTIGAQYIPSQEVAGLVIVLTIQATAAAANWNVTFAQLVIQQ